MEDAMSAKWTKKAEKYYDLVMREVKKTFGDGQFFLVRDAYNKMDILRHLSDAYAYDIIMGVLLMARDKNEIVQIGRHYVINEKAKAK
jgi:hypothetical protein